ncbi:hypothetical protein BLNAU_12805 [Blattamonas nauphoetae]|uniref:Uncharacterized protein n=1 Tax=Blattamonas nauphoetae TaxID=2049346 RepID=A0ABQ9XJR6_9EUKA|nr:hypothetical protein BLNAU_12805 [Blattamonas nauphoetae]
MHSVVVQQSFSPSLQQVLAIQIDPFRQISLRWSLTFRDHILEVSVFDLLKLPPTNTDTPDDAADNHTKEHKHDCGHDNRDCRGGCFVPGMELRTRRLPKQE